MSVTIKDVAKLAGVSIATASVAINQKSGVSAKARKSVSDAVEKLGYKPNHYARRLITKRSKTVGLIVSDILNPFFGLVIRNIQHDIEKLGYTLLLGVSNEQITMEKKIVDYFVEMDIEGLIIVPSLEKEPDLGHLYNLKKLGIPFVFITTYYKQIEADIIMSDLGEGSYQLTKYLLENGKEKIYFLYGFNNLELSRLRLTGFIRAFKEYGMNYRDTQIVECYPDYSNGYSVTKKVLAQEKPDAIITVNDMVALGAIKCLKDSNIKVPDEISVAGYDDLLYASILDTPLTTVKQPIEDICKESVRTLMDRINGQTYPKKAVLLEPSLIVRNSTLGKNSR